MIEMEMSSGNVFADLGLPNPEERLLRSQIVHEIHTRLTERKLTARAAAKVLQEPVEIARQFLAARFVDLPLERLLTILQRLDLRAVLSFESATPELQRPASLPGQLARLDADLIAAFPTSAEVNEALRSVLRARQANWSAPSASDSNIVRERRKRNYLA